MTDSLSLILDATLSSSSEKVLLVQTYLSLFVDTGLPEPLGFFDL